jgi:hypothetical protein
MECGSEIGEWGLAVDVAESEAVVRCDSGECRSSVHDRRVTGLMVIDHGTLRIS